MGWDEIRRAVGFGRSGLLGKEQGCGFCRQHCRNPLLQGGLCGLDVSILPPTLAKLTRTYCPCNFVKLVQNYPTSLPLPEFPRVEITLLEVASMKHIISAILKLSCKNWTTWLGVGERTCVSMFSMRNVVVHVLVEQFSPIPSGAWDLQIFDVSAFSMLNPLQSLSLLNVFRFHSAPGCWERAGFVPRPVGLT